MEADEEYVEMVREAILADAKKPKQPGDAPEGPSLGEWSALHDILADLVDSIRVLEAAVIAAAGAKPPRPKPYSRPQTPMTQMAESVRIEAKRARHEMLVRKLIPHAE